MPALRSFNEAGIVDLISEQGSLISGLRIILYFTDPTPLTPDGCGWCGEVCVLGSEDVYFGSVYTIKARANIITEVNVAIYHNFGKKEFFL
jgi:hypothetical protein